MPATTAKSSRRAAKKRKALRTARAAAIDAGFGRFRHLGISSDEYALEKQREIVREDRAR